jgi:single-strand DNA-binding protein
MASFNKVILMGNLTRDPEVRYTPNGAAVCELGLAVSRKFNVNGQDRDEVCFVDIVVWNKQAENCGKYLQKGRPVLIEGRLQLDTWQNKEGQNRSKLRVVAESVQFMPRAAEAGTAPAQQNYNKNYSQQQQQNNNINSQQQPTQQQNNNMNSQQQPTQQPAPVNNYSEPMPQPPEDIYNSDFETEDDIPF